MENDRWKSSWRDKLLLSRDKHDYIMLTDASYKDEDGLDNGDTNPYWVGSFYNVKNSAGSFRQWRNSGEPDSTLFVRNELQDPRVGYPKNQFFFNIVHFDIYQKQIVKDKNGNVVLAKNGENAGQPFKSWDVVEGIKNRKTLAKNPDEDTAFFRKKFLQVGPTHYDNLLTIIDKAKEICFCGGRLDIAGYECESCGAEMLDMNDPNLTIEDVNRYGDGKRRCSHCRHLGFPVPTQECDSCDNPRPHRFDQVVAKVKKSGQGPQTVIQIDDVISITEFEMDNRERVVAVDEEGLPIEEDGEVMWASPELETVCSSEWDFDGGNPPPGNGEVSTFLGLTPADEGYSQQTTPYSKTKKSISKRRFR